MTTNLVPIARTGALTRRDPKRLELFTRTVGKDLRGAEIDEAIEWCELYGANPFVKDIYFFVFDANDAKKRRVVPVLGIGLYRKIAARTGNYRPDEAPPRFVYDETAKGPTNPTGMVSCEVSINVYSHGDWHKVTSRLRWEERAPIKEIWEHGQPTGRFRLDPKKDNWHRMGETMMAKCVEADAIRKAFPNETAGSYVEEEIDAAHTIDLTATEIIEQTQQDAKLRTLNAANALTVMWSPSQPLEHVPIGVFGDRAIAWIKANADEPMTVQLWAEQNRAVLREYFVRDKAGALEVKRALEAVKSEPQL